MNFELWYIPLIAMAVVVIPPTIFSARTWLRLKSPNAEAQEKLAKEIDNVASPRGQVSHQLGRVRLLAFMTVVLLIGFFFAIGPAAASLIASAATAASTAASAAWTIASYLTLQEIRAQQNGGPQAPGPPSPDQGPAPG